MFSESACQGLLIVNLIALRRALELVEHTSSCVSTKVFWERIDLGERPDLNVSDTNQEGKRAGGIKGKREKAPSVGILSLWPGCYDASSFAPLYPLIHDGLKPLKLWAHINLSSLWDFFFQVFGQSDDKTNSP
jgi:hypothetical protein